MDLIVSAEGQIRCIYGEWFDLASLGQLTLRRASHVEPDSAGQWWADLRPVAGPVIGPFALRSQALGAESVWLQNNWLTQTFET